MLLRHTRWLVRASLPDLALLYSEVHVWQACLDHPLLCLQRLADTLSSGERDRANKFRFKRDRDRFVAGRGFLRVLLGAYSGKPPDYICFRYGLHGKPELEEEPSTDTLHFNLSHSEEVALYVVARGRRVGIDVEKVQHITEAKEIAEHLFSAKENATLDALPASKKQKAFLDLWVRKEAYGKAFGSGLKNSSQVSIVSARNRPGQLLTVEGDEVTTNHWFLQDISPTPKFAAALSVEGSEWPSVCWRWLDQYLQGGFNPRPDRSKTISLNRPGDGEAVMGGKPNLHRQ